MTELKWIKHDGGPMPVPGDTVVCWCDSGKPEAFDEDYTARACQLTCWEDLTHYAIVKPSQSEPAIDAHYTKLKIEPMTYSMENGLDPMQHIVIKYVTRFRDKHGKRDLLAARHVIDMMIEREYGE